MGRPKKGEPGYAKANKKWKETMLRKYGGEDGLHSFMCKIGSKGGKNGAGPDYNGGFASSPDLARKAGAKGGKASKRGYKLIGEDKRYYMYENLTTGEVIKKSKKS